MQICLPFCWTKTSLQEYEFQAAFGVTELYEKVFSSHSIVLNTTDYAMISATRSSTLSHLLPGLSDYAKSVVYPSLRRRLRRASLLPWAEPAADLNAPLLAPLSALRCGSARPR